MSYLPSDPRFAKKRSMIRAKRGARDIEISPRKTGRHFYLNVYSCKERRDLYCVSTLNLPKSKPLHFANKADAYEVGKALGEWISKNATSDKSIYFNKLNYAFHGKLSEAVRGIKEVVGDVF